MEECFKLPSSGRVSFFDSGAQNAAVLELDRNSNTIDTTLLSTYLTNVSDVKVSSSNAFFAVKDGVLYSKDM